MRNPVLISYAYFRDWPDDRLKVLLGNRLVEWLVDSGGFTALNAGWQVGLKHHGVRVYNAVTNVDVDAIVREIEKEEARCRK